MKRNDELWENAERVIPGGVNSPVRAFRGVGGTPRFLARGQGCKVWDVDGKEYVDYVGSWGPLLLGHAHPAIVEAVRAAAGDGLTFGAPTEREVQLANAVSRLVPAAQKIRLVTSGTEATMTAVRLARGFTRRDRVIKFAGAYHGHADTFLIKAGSGGATFGTPDSAGVPAGVAALTHVARFNDLASVRAVFTEYPQDVAAVIVEPILGNVGVVPPADGFLRGLKKLCDEFGALLVFDEVITGFRVGFGGAQELYGVTPDLCTLGKILGGGLPLAAVAGRAGIMDHLAPLGKVYQAGTLSGNPLATAAALATLNVLETKPPYPALDGAAKKLADGITAKIAEAGVAATVNRVGSMFTIFFTKDKVADAETALRADAQAYGRFFHACLEEGVYLPPSQYETAFVSTAHDGAAIDRTIAAVAKALQAAKPRPA